MNARRAAEETARLGKEIYGATSGRASGRRITETTLPSMWTAAATVADVSPRRSVSSPNTGRRGLARLVTSMVTDPAIEGRAKPSSVTLRGRRQEVTIRLLGFLTALWDGRPEGYAMAQ